MKILIDMIHPNPYNLREYVDKVKLRELAESIASDGLLQPILVRPVTDEYGETIYEIVHGYRRWLAHQELGLEEIECFVEKVSDKNIILLSLNENIHDEPLLPLEMAKGLDLLQKKFTPDDFKDKLESKFPEYFKKLHTFEILNQKMLGVLIHKSPGWISETLGHLKIIEPLKEKIESVKKKYPEKKEEMEKDQGYMANFINTKPTLAKIIKANTFDDETNQQLELMKLFDKYDIKQDTAKALMKYLRSNFPYKKKVSWGIYGKSHWEERIDPYIDLSKLVKDFLGEYETLKLTVKKDLKTKLEETYEGFKLSQTISEISEKPLKPLSLEQFALKCLEHGLEKWEEWVTIT